MAGYFDHIKQPDPTPIPASTNVVPLRPAGDLHPYAAAVISYELARLDALTRPWREGAGWDTTTFEVACNLLEIANSPWSGYTAAQAERDLYDHAPSDQRWGAREHERKWDSARQRVGLAVRPEPATDERFTPTVIEVAATDLAPDVETSFWDERPILQHIHDAARARMVAPWGVLGVTMARALALTPFAVQLPPIVGSAASLNFAVALVAKSGGGKGGADGVAHDAIHMPYTPEFRIGSGEAIAHCLKHRRTAKNGGGEDWNTDSHNALINISEVDKLTAQAQRQGATIMPELRAAWSGEALGHITADASRRLPVEKGQYRLALILGVQPGRAGGLLDDSDGGFPQRLIWLPAYDADAPTMDALPEWPGQITWTPPRVTGLDRTMSVCEIAAQEIREARWRANRGEGDPLDGHLLLAREKVAAALAVLDGRYDITDDDWRLAGIVVAKSNATREGIRAQLQRARDATYAASGVAEAERQVAREEAVADKRDRAVKRLCRKLIDCLTDEWTTRSTITAGWVAGRDRAYLDEALHLLVETGQLEEHTEGRRTRYRLSGGTE